MPRRAVLLLPFFLIIAALAAFQPPADPLEAGFRQPPPPARPHLYFMLLNGHVDRAYLEKEIAAYAQAGIGGLCVFDVGARGDTNVQPPAGPAFLSPESAADLAYLMGVARRHGLEVDLSVSSSWDMGAGWVTPEDAAMTLAQSSLEIEGGRPVDVQLPFPPVPPEAPRRPGGALAFARDAAVLAVLNPGRVQGHEFVFELRPPLPQEINRVVLYNNPVPEKGGTTHYARQFTVSVSGATTPRAGNFRQIARGTLEPRGGPQEFRFPPTPARYVRLHLLNGYDSDRVELAEFEVFSTAGDHVNPHWRVRVTQDPAGLIRFTSARGQLGDWAPENIHDGVKQGPRHSWASGLSASLRIPDSRAIVNLTSNVDAQGRLRWNAPAGQWLILRYVTVNTGEKLKVPSPNSDGLATDHFNPAATRRYIAEVIRRLKAAIPSLRGSALRDLYLASYEVRGLPWTPAFLDEFRRRRGYDFAPFLPILSGGIVDSDEATERVLFDFRKTQGELLVDAYYRAAVETAHSAGLTIESEAGGPGPHLHQVPVDALLAQGAIDSVRGEFWPDRMNYNVIWVVKETASAAHIYGKPLVHMESFTSSNHWQEGPQDLKLAADRAFAEGMNHVVWHTAAHQPPAAGQPGWVYYAGTHLNLQVPWWPMAHAFLSYLARSSFLLQQGQPVADVLYYYGDQGYNFVPPKHVDPNLGQGYEYDVTNAGVLQRRIQVRDGKLTLPEGIQYELLILPDRDDIDLAVLERLETLVRAGATVVGRKPVRSSGYSGFPERDKAVQTIAARLWSGCDGQGAQEVSYGQGRIVCGLTPRQVLAARRIPPDFRFESAAPGADLDFTHRSAPGAEIYFVRNKTPHWADVQAEFRVKGRQPELWDAATGEHRDQPAYEFTAQGTKLPLRLEPQGAIFVVFRRPARPSAAPPALPAPAPQVLSIPGPWKLSFVSGPAAPEPVRLTQLRSWTASPDPKEKYFSGLAEYETEFSLPSAWLTPGRTARLDLGDLWAVAEVSLNGRDLGVVWKRPFTAEATNALRPGTNKLKIRVANNWVNRLVGDAQPGAPPHAARTNVLTTGGANPRPWKDVELHESGLLGPVRLESVPAEAWQR